MMNAAACPRAAMTTNAMRPRTSAVDHPCTTSSTIGGGAVEGRRSCHGSFDEFGHLGGCPADLHTRGLERLGLGLGGPARARDDGACMAHAFTGRRGEPGDVADDRLLHPLRDERRGMLLVIAPDLPDQHHEIGLGVHLEQLEGVDEADAVDGVASHPHARGLPHTAFRQLVHDLVGEGTRTRDQAHRPGHTDLPGDDPDVRLPRRDDAGAVRSNQRGRPASQVSHHLRHVPDGDALGDAHDESKIGIGRLVDGLRGESRRYEDQGGVRAGLGHRLGHRVEDRDALHVQTGLAGGHSGHHLGPICPVTQPVERALPASQSLYHDAGCVVDEDRHQAALASSAARCAASSIVSAGTIRGWLASARMVRPSGAFVPSKRTTIWTVGVTRSRASRIPRATTSPRVMPPKMFTRADRTLESDKITSSETAMTSALAPPPMSRKLAGFAPASSTTSRVAITRPAPLPMIPTSPSSFTYWSPASLARASTGSMGNVARRASSSGCRHSALSSIVTFESRATTRPSARRVSGLTSTRVASFAARTSDILASTAPAPSRAPAGRWPTA